MKEILPSSLTFYEETLIAEQHIREFTRRKYIHLEQWSNLKDAHFGELFTMYLH